MRYIVVRVEETAQKPEAAEKAEAPAEQPAEEAE